MKAASDTPGASAYPLTAFRKIPEGSKKVAGAWSASAEPKGEGGKRHPREEVYTLSDPGRGRRMQ